MACCRSRGCSASSKPHFPNLGFGGGAEQTAKLSPNGFQTFYYEDCFSSKLAFREAPDNSKCQIVPALRYFGELQIVF
jgi:hypothetical protein